jgi:hypothetical protein
MTGIAACCALAPTDPAATAAPTDAMNSRRLMASPKHRTLHRSVGHWRS